MKIDKVIALPIGVMALALMLGAIGTTGTASAQQQVAAAETSGQTAPDPLNADELEVLVARIALYPDELIAVITGASLTQCKQSKRSDFSPTSEG